MPSGRFDLGTPLGFGTRPLLSARSLQGGRLPGIPVPATAQPALEAEGMSPLSLGLQKTFEPFSHPPSVFPRRSPRLFSRAPRRAVSAPFARASPSVSSAAVGDPSVGSGIQRKRPGSRAAAPPCRAAPGSRSGAAARVALVSRQLELSGSGGRERGAPRRQQDSPYPRHSSRWLAWLSWAKGETFLVRK